MSQLRPARLIDKSSSACRPNPKTCGLRLEDCDLSKVSSQSTFTPHVAPNPETWLSARRFHQAFHLDLPNGFQLRVTYSDIGLCPQDQDEDISDSAHEHPRAVVVFIGGLMGGRYTVCHLHEFCRQHGIRIITVDRPGMGGSTAVPLQQRMATWLATFEGLMDHLKLRNVAIASHSGGAIYATNTLIHYRRYLDSQRPAVAYIAPFCHPSESGALTATTAVLKVLPGSAVARFDKLARVVSGISFSLAWSSGLIASDPMPVDTDSVAVEDRVDVDMDWWAKVSKYVYRCAMAEDISGSSGEALLYLRKGEAVPWVVRWTTYQEAARLVAGNCESDAARLHVSVYHAAKDEMIGSKGAIYFDRCWTVGQDSEASQRFLYTSEVCAGTDHETILSPDKIPLKKWLKSLVAE